MTKRMKINELVSKLKSAVKVWSKRADKAYPISHLFIGSINEEDFVYIKIDDGNLVDLSKIWHDASEGPRAKEWIIVQFGEDNYGTMSLSDFGAKMWCNSCKIIRWAYVSDLLPKGGEK